MAEAALNSPAIQPDLDALIALRREVRGNPLRPRGPARGLLAGTHRSRFRGRGMDYLESRIYQPGDDIRNLDWRVTARSGKVHTKMYQEERERPVVVLADFGPGMFFATQGVFKSVIAARAAAFIAWSAIAHGDRIGALLFNGDHRELKPRGGDKGVLRLIRELIAVADPIGGARAEAHPKALNEALLRLRRVARPGSLVVILSDFHEIDDETAILLGQLRRHNEILACQILDRLEIEPPPPAVYPVSDGRQRGWLDISRRDRRDAYRDLFAQRHRRLDEMLKAQAIPLSRLTTSDDVAARLRDWLRAPVAGKAS